MNRLILPFVLASAATASAQSFNIDVGENTTFPVPSASFGGAANRPGTWNAVNASVTGQALVKLDGSPSTVTISVTGGQGNYEADHSGTSGDHEKLLDDVQDITSGSPAWTIAGLAAGQYDVYTYAWAPDSNNYFTNVTVPGGGGMQAVGGVWNGSFVQGKQYAKHTVNVPANGSIVVNLSIGAQFGSCNGFQIVTNDATLATPFCFGTGQALPCPCFNSGAAGRGCANSAVGLGALLAASGTTTPDALVLTASDMPPTAFAIFLQGTANAAPGVAFGDGLRCAAGNLKRLAVKSSVGGVAQFPAVGDPSVSAQSAALGDTLTPGATRYYQTYYRDPNPAFCPAPQGDTFNVTNGLIVVW